MCIKLRLFTSILMKRWIDLRGTRFDAFNLIAKEKQCAKCRKQLSLQIVNTIYPCEDAKLTDWRALIKKTTEKLSDKITISDPTSTSTTSYGIRFHQIQKRRGNLIKLQKRPIFCLQSVFYDMITENVPLD